MSCFFATFFLRILFRALFALLFSTSILSSLIFCRSAIPAVVDVLLADVPGVVAVGTKPGAGTVGGGFAWELTGGGVAGPRLVEAGGDGGDVLGAAWEGRLLWATKSYGRHMSRK